LSGNGGPAVSKNHERISGQKGTLANNIPRPRNPFCVKFPANEFLTVAIVDVHRRVYAYNT